MPDDAPQSPDAADAPVDPRQLLDDALPDDPVDSTPNTDPTDGEPVSSEMADAPKPEGDDATGTPPTESASSDSADGDDAPLSALAKLDRVNGTNYAAGDEEEGWRRVNEAIRLQQLLQRVDPSLDKLQALIDAGQAPAEPAKEAPPDEDELEYNPAYGTLTPESDPKLLANYQEFNRQLVPRTVENIRETKAVKKELAELRDMIEKQTAETRQTTQQQRDRADYDTFVAKHTDKMFIDGDPNKGQTPFGEAFHSELNGETFLDPDTGRMRMPAKSALQGAFGIAAANNLAVFAPKAPADAPRKPSASGMKAGPNTAKPRPKSAADILREQLKSVGPNYDMAAEVNKALQAAEAG